MTTIKTLTKKSEIAQAVNFKNEYSVLEMDVANTSEICGDVCGYEGCKVRLDFGDEYYHNAQINYYKDCKKVIISLGPVCLKAGLNYYDIKEMLEYRNAPIIRNGQEAIFVAYNSKNKKVLPFQVIKIDGLRKNVASITLLENADFIETLE